MEHKKSEPLLADSNSLWNDSNMGARIKEKRKSLKMTQKQLATRVNKAESSIQKYESGAVEIPYSVILEIAKELNSTAPYLLGYEDIRKEYNELQLFKEQLKLLDCDYEYVDTTPIDSYMHEDARYLENENKEEPYYSVTFNNTTTRIPVVAFDNFKEDTKSYLKFKLLELLNKYQ